MMSVLPVAPRAPVVQARVALETLAVLVVVAPRALLAQAAHGVQAVQLLLPALGARLVLMSSLLELARAAPGTVVLAD